MIIFFNISINAQNSLPKGSIKGMVVDAETQAPLTGANIVILNTLMGAATDSLGNYVIKNVPAGSYVLQFHFIGYQTLTKTDIIVRPQRVTSVNCGLPESYLEENAVVVSAGYFDKQQQQPLSTISFSREEIRRAPGSAGDVSRIIMGLPSIAKVNDQSNSLIVRGGSPVENAFFIDNIEIPNINHFPTQGTSGGPIGLINVDFIDDVSFSAGGFSAAYGDRLSSVMDIKFREGNRERYDAQLDFNFAGFGGVFEGPLLNENSSFMISLRRSYLDLLIKAADIGTSVAPRYGDYQGKFVFDISPQHKLTFLGIFGDDHNNPDREAALENDMIVYGNQDIYENTAGINWRAIWNKNGYSNTSFSWTGSYFKEDYFETNSSIHLIKNRSTENSFKLRNINHIRINKNNAIEFGAEVKQTYIDYNNYFSEYTDAIGDSTSAFFINDRIDALKYGMFLNYLFNPVERLSATLGLRADYFTLNKNFHLAPRLALAYRLNPEITLNAAIGVYYQNLPLVLLSQNKKNKDIDDPRSVHYIFGIDYLLTPSTKLSMELYQKNYQNMPLDSQQPGLFLLDELFYRYGFFFNHGALNDKGSARSRGVEMIIQKKLAEEFYGLISASYFRSEYKIDNNWTDRVFDNRFIFGMEGGYKPGDNWEFSLRWIFAGGAPYTPFNISQSEQINRAVLDQNRINKARYPEYHSLNVRFDRRFHFEKSNLVAYLSVWNAYNRKNIASYFWNENENKKDVIYQWSTLPIIGLEFEF
ncbi:MAG: TonB-dependent receptor [Calditrichae bacterium]|nr:TonB-dependent receptor [Calditrichia bacterium]